MHRLLIAPLLVVACAPLVSRRKPVHEPPKARAVVAAPQPKPRVEPPPPAPPPPPREPAVIVRAPPPPPPAPAPEPEPVEADVDEVPAAPAARTSYYAFSDREINALRKRNKKFAKLHSEHKTCAARSEKLITKKGELREQIIELQNKEYRTPKEDRKLASLRKEEHAMKRDKASIAACEPVEEKLTQMLIDAYGTTASM